MKDTIETLPFEVVNDAATTAHLIICDHASNHVPGHLANLGLPPERLLQHIAIDIGAGTLSRNLAERLDCTAVLCGTSRLVVDCNRLPYTDDWIPANSDGVIIPGNQNLTSDEIEHRMRCYFRPYHREIERRLETITKIDRPTVLVSIHSFTPSMEGVKRPWDVGILSDRDRRVADRLIENLRQVNNLKVGDNEPYTGTSPLGYGLKTYNQERGLPYAMFEIRQDLLEDETGISRWTELCADALLPILEDYSINDVERMTKS